MKATRRIAAGLRPDVASVASLFISRWDTAVAAEVPESLRNRLGIAIGRRAYRANVELMASTGTKDPKAPDTLCVQGLGAPHTVNTMPEGTLKALADHGQMGPPLAPDGGDCEGVIAGHEKASCSPSSSRRAPPSAQPGRSDAPAGLTRNLFPGVLPPR